jgi:hypothetical protein
MSTKFYVRREQNELLQIDSTMKTGKVIIIVKVAIQNYLAQK